MPSPFPGMDPYLEDHTLWSTVHFWLIAGLAEQLKASLPTDVLVSVEERLYLSTPEELPSTPRVHIVPDVTLKGGRSTVSGAGTAVLSRPVHVLAPVPETVRERYLEIRDLRGGDKVLTVLEVLSPTNKRPGPGRTAYLDKRAAVLSSDTSLVEIDLLRSGARMPIIDAPPATDYRVFVSPGETRPHAELYPFTLRDPLPTIAVPVRAGSEPVPLELGVILAATYERGSFSQRVDYGADPTPSLSTEDSTWADVLLREHRLR